MEVLPLDTGKKVEVALTQLRKPFAGMSLQELRNLQSRFVILM